MKGLAWLVRDLDLYQLGFLIWALGALAVMGVIFGIGVAIGRWIS